MNLEKPEHVPLEFSEQLIERATKIARTGATIPRIAEACMVDPKNFRRWMQLGRDEAERYPLFNKLYTSVTEARNSAHDGLLSRVMESAQEDWKAAAWTLERSFGYHKNQEVTVQAPDQPLTLELIARIPADQVQQIEAESVVVNDQEDQAPNA